MDTAAPPPPGRFMRVIRACLWIAALVIGAGGAYVVVLGIVDSGDTAPEVFYAIGGIGMVAAAVLALAAYTLRR